MKLYLRDGDSLIPLPDNPKAMDKEQLALVAKKFTMDPEKLGIELDNALMVYHLLLNENIAGRPEQREALEDVSEGASRLMKGLRALAYMGNSTLATLSQ